jgi:hypothetical protein
LTILPFSGRREGERSEEVCEALRAFEGPDGFVGPCEMLVAVGTK